MQTFDVSANILNDKLALFSTAGSVASFGKKASERKKEKACSEAPAPEVPSAPSCNGHVFLIYITVVQIVMWGVLCMQSDSVRQIVSGLFLFGTPACIYALCTPPRLSNRKHALWGVFIVHNSVVFYVFNMHQWWLILTALGASLLIFALSEAVRRFRGA